MRNWLAEKISDQADILESPYDLIERLVKQGKALGLQETADTAKVHASFFMNGNKNSTNACKFCDAFGCVSSLQKGFKSCLCFGDSDLSEFTSSIQTYVLSARKYIQSKPSLKDLKGVKFPIDKKMKQEPEATRDAGVMSAEIRDALQLLQGPGFGGRVIQTMAPRELRNGHDAEYQSVGISTSLIAQAALSNLQEPYLYLYVG